MQVQEAALPAHAGTLSLACTAFKPHCQQVLRLRRKLVFTLTDTRNLGRF